MNNSENRNSILEISSRIDKVFEENSEKSIHNFSVEQEILRSENLRMQNKILILLSEIDLEKCKSEKLFKVFI